MILKQSTARNKLVFMTDSADHVTGKASLTLTITASKDGAAFSSISPTVTDLGNGWYNLALTTSHTDTLGDLALHITSTGADPSDYSMQVCLGLPGENTSDISAIKAKTDNLPSDPADASVIAGRFDTVDSSLIAIAGYIDTEVGAIKASTDNLPSDPADASVIAARFDTIDTTLSTLFKPMYLRGEEIVGFQFAMYDADGELAVGLTVSVEVSQDGGAFTASDNSVSEISDGWYKITFSDTETDCKSLAVRAFATGAKDLPFVLPMEG